MADDSGCARILAELSHVRAPAMTPTLFSGKPASKTGLASATALTALVLVAVSAWMQTAMGERLLPHAFCISASQPLLVLHVVSDGLIAFAYLLIPWAMLNFMRKRPDVPFGWVVWVFTAFIVACGFTHALEMWTLWYPAYWYSGVAKGFTALVSLGTAWLLYRLTPQALAQPSAQQLREANTALQQEIEARKSAQQQLAAAKAQVEELLVRSKAQEQQTSAVLDSFFELAPVGLVLLDQKNHILRFNLALLQTTKRPPRDYIGKRIDDLPGMAEEALKAIGEVRATGQVRTNVQIERTSRDGRTRVWLCDYFPICVGEREPLVGAVVQDMSYQRQVERQLLQSASRAEEANRSKDQFLAKVSHELRSPLQVALSSTEVLRRLPDLPEQARKFIDRMGHAISQQARMINDLIDLSRIQSGKLHLANERVDPALPLRRVLDHWIGVARERNVHLETDGLGSTHVIVEADPARLEQVYANLLDNAIRFSPAGGRMEVASAVAGGRWRFIVRDFGVGLTSEEIQSVFRPFAQGPVQPASGKGLGLGLAIVSNLAEALGGRVWAESEGRGKGATFFFELPLASAASATPAPSDENNDAPPPRLDGLRVLYVEDEEEVANAMRDGLASLGAQVLAAVSYGGALQALQSQGFDVLVTDLNLGPGPGGYEVAATARAMPAHARMPIIGVSAFGTQEDLAATQRSGFAAHLVKPATLRAVADAIRRAAPFTAT
jgi:signal transduction histidine kinase